MKKHKHLIDSNESYYSHSRWALDAGCKLIISGIKSTLHAIYPGWFPFASAKTVIDLYYKRLHNHTNPQYQEYIAQVRDQTKQ
jgi:hypothetical protein